LYRAPLIKTFFSADDSSRKGFCGKDDVMNWATIVVGFCSGLISGGAVLYVMLKGRLPSLAALRAHDSIKDLTYYGRKVRCRK
jgi:hypothetical protein